MFEKILVSYDGSDHARNALDTAIGMSKTFGSELYVSHTPQVDTPPIVVGAFVDVLQVPPTADQIRKAGQHICDEARAIAEEAGAGIRDCYVGSGNPATSTLTTADKVGADLIVMGRRGLGSIKALALGSVSQAVSHGAKCAVMTVV